MREIDSLFSLYIKIGQLIIQSREKLDAIDVNDPDFYIHLAEQRGEFDALSKCSVMVHDLMIKRIKNVK